MHTTLKYLFLTAIRDRLFASMLVALALIALVCSFIGDKTVVEGSETVSALAGFSSRLLVIAGLSLFVAVHVRRTFENREILLLLSRPMSRPGLVVAYWASFSAIAALTVVPAAVAIWLVGQPDLGGLVWWAVSLALEAMLMVAIALFFSLTIGSVVAAAAGTLGFYILGRGIGVFTAIATGEFRSADTGLDQAVNSAIGYIAWIVPRLDLFGQSSWLVYGAPEAGMIVLIAAQALVYTALIVTAAIFDFERKRF